MKKNLLGDIVVLNTNEDFSQTKHKQFILNHMEKW